MSFGLARNSLCKGLVKATAMERLSDNPGERNKQEYSAWEFLVTPFCDEYIMIFLCGAPNFDACSKAGSTSNNRQRTHMEGLCAGLVPWNYWILSLLASRRHHLQNNSCRHAAVDWTWPDIQQSTQWPSTGHTSWSHIVLRSVKSIKATDQCNNGKHSIGNIVSTQARLLRTALLASAGTQQLTSYPATAIRRYVRAL